MSIRRRVRLALMLSGLVTMPDTMSRLWAQAGPQGGAQANPSQRTVQMRIGGMTCASCANGLEASFRNMAGVLKARVDYRAGDATVTFDTSKQSAESLAKFAVTCGYKVKETKVI